MRRDKLKEGEPDGGHLAGRQRRNEEKCEGGEFKVVMGKAEDTPA